MKKQQLREIALDMARDVGLINVSQGALCEAAGIPVGSFAHVAGQRFSEFMGELLTDAESHVATVAADPAKNRARALPEVRRRQLFDAAIAVAESEGYNTMTRGMIAKRAGVAPGLVTHYLGDMESIRERVLCAAIREQNLDIIAQGVMQKSPLMREVDERIKRRALNSVIRGGGEK